MYLNSKLARSVKLALAIGAASTAAFTSTTALAQEEAADGDVEKIAVTGSRIRRADVEGANPISVMDAIDIEKFGITSIGDVLQSIPAAGSAINTNSNNGGNGTTTLNIRGLGSNRTLVLVNGKRWSAGLGGAVDLNNIPSAIIDRIEVLKDGASAVYGSDAIAGVVNIITRQDFQGFHGSAYVGEYDEGDGRKEDANIGFGASTDKANVYFNLNYVNEEPTFAGDREISAVPVFGAPTGFGGSSGTPNGRLFWFDEDGNLRNEQGDGNGGLIPWTGSSAFNFAPFNYLSTPQERTNIYVQGSYELTDNIKATATGFYGNRRSAQFLAPTPLFLGIAGGNPDFFIPAEFEFNPTGIDLFGDAGFGAPNSLYFAGRRMFEAGNREFKQNVDQYQFNYGLEGTFEAGDREFFWDVGYTYSRIEQNSITDGLLNMDRVRASLVCGTEHSTDPACVALNLYGGSSDIGVGSMTQEMIDYITFTAQDAAGTDMLSYQANIAGDVMELPAGPMMFAAGWEKRWQSGFDQPDALIAAGITSGNSRQPTEGKFSVEEYYLELAIPLLADQPFAKALDLELATRYSDYSNFGDTTNSKVGIKWRINDELMFRGTFSEAFRAPALTELFLGSSDSFPTLNDPCNGGEAGNPDLPGCAGIPSTYQQPNAQIRITVGGNENLQPEEAESFTYGVVYAPEWLDGLSMTLDVFDVEVDNAVSTIGGQAILNACASDGVTLCSLLDRNAGGGVADIRNNAINTGGQRTNGFDGNIEYAFETEGYGEFKLSWDMTYIDERATIFVDPVTGNSEVFSEQGRAFDRDVVPRIRSNININWAWEDFTANYLIRYIHGTLEDCNLGTSGTADAVEQDLCSNPEDVNAPDYDGDLSTNDLDPMAYHDVSFGYHINDNLRLTIGVNNLWDTDPEVSFTTFANSFDPSMYEIPGRFMYSRVSFAF